MALSMFLAPLNSLLGEFGLIQRTKLGYRELLRAGVGGLPALVIAGGSL